MGRTYSAGDSPAWWANDGLDRTRKLGEADAGFWLAGHYEDVIADVGKVARERARLLNAALNAGAVADCLVAAAAILAAHTLDWFAAIHN